MANTRTLSDALKESVVETRGVKTTEQQMVRTEDYGWDDLVISIHAMGTNNPNPPVWRKRVDSGVIPVEKILEIRNGSDEDTYLKIDKNSDNDISGTTAWSIAFWVTPQSRGSGLIDLGNVFSLDVTFNDELRIKYGNNTAETLVSTVVYGKRYCVIVTGAQSHGEMLIRAWVNNRRKMRESYSSIPSSSYSVSWLIGARGGTSTAGTDTSGDNPWWFGDAAFDELRFFKGKALTSSERSSFWNSGDGTAESISNAETGWYAFNNTLDDTANGNTAVVIGTHYQFVDGGVGGGNGLDGLYSPVFEAGDNQQVEFSQQVLHKFANGEAFRGRLHMHIQIRQHDNPELGYDPSFSTVLPKLLCEYTLNNVFEEESYTQTQENVTIVSAINTDYNSAWAPRTHCIVMWYIEETEDGTEMRTTTAGNLVSPSAMFSGRIYRDENDGSPYDIYMLQPDAHLRTDKPGTAFEWVDANN